ncbi:hypothetical protein [Alteromonas antoniana]|uniref:hypothetical protein n=1 Tax=Alteromonas antoniana TaxID=2803813 RepID=UPI001C44D503|nr:hypothetical protein [Alteromonas antoniana]
MKKFVRFVMILVPAFLVTYSFACIFHTQSVLARLSELDVQIPLAERLATIAYDLAGLLPAYGTAIFAMLFIAMGVASLSGRFLPHRGALYAFICACAGAFGMLAMLLAMHPIMEVTLIAGARETGGKLLQSSAGFLGGLTFAVTDQVFRAK